MRQPSPAEKVVITSTEKLENEIKQKEKEILLWKNTAESLKKNSDYLIQKIDSLSKVKRKVKIEYREVYKNITSASNNELDSLIRANW